MISLSLIFSPSRLDHYETSGSGEICVGRILVDLCIWILVGDLYMENTCRSVDCWLLIVDDYGWLMIDCWWFMIHDSWYILPLYRQIIDTYSSFVTFKMISSPPHPTLKFVPCVSLLPRIPGDDRNRIGRYPSRMTGLVGMHYPR